MSSIEYLIDTNILIYHTKGVTDHYRFSQQSDHSRFF